MARQLRVCLSFFLLSLALSCVDHVACEEVTGAETAESTFDAYIGKHQREYQRGSAEYAARRLLFEERAREAAAHNSRPDRLWTYDASNRFADRTAAELASLRGWRRPALQGASAHSPAALLAVATKHGRGKELRHRCNFPEDVSWAHLNATRTAGDQGSCGSCSALATAAALAAHHELHRGSTRSFAPQELVSCVPNPEACGGQGGCKGGFMELLMAYVLRHGLHEEKDYPYTSSFTSETGECKTRTTDDMVVGTQPGIYGASMEGPSANFGMVGYERLPVNQYEPLLQALVERGPVVVALAASGWHWYGGGIFNGCAKDAVVDHAVVLLGFGVDKRRKKRYWHLLNSWGPDWGEAGKLRLLRRDDEASWCGLDSEPQLGAACARNKDGSWKPTPLEPVEVCGNCGILFNAVVPHFEGQTHKALELSSLRTSCSWKEG